MQIEKLLEIQTILQRVAELGLTAVVIDGKTISGLDPNKTVAVFTNNYEQSLTDYPMAITRVKQLDDRIKLVAGNQPTATLSTIDDYHSTLEMTTDVHSVQFRFANPTMVEYPKSIKGKDAVTFTLDQTQTQQIIAGAAAFKPEVFRLIAKEKTVEVEMLDATNDKLLIKLPVVTSASEQITYQYTADSMLRIFSQKGVKSIQCTIMEPNGLLRVNYKGLPVYVRRRG